MSEACNTHGRNLYNILVRKPEGKGREGKGREGKGPLGIPRYRWEDNIRIDLTGIRLEVV